MARRHYQVIAIHVAGVLAISLSIYAITRSRYFKDTIGSVLGKKKKQSAPKDFDNEAEDLEEVDEEEEEEDDDEVNNNKGERKAVQRRRGRGQGRGFRFRSRLGNCCNSGLSSQSDGEWEKKEERDLFDSFRVGGSTDDSNSHKMEPSATAPWSSSKIHSQNSGNFVEDEGGIWGFGVDSSSQCGCGAGDVKSEGEHGDGKVSNCGHSCGTCKEGSEKVRPCVEPRVEVQPLNPPTAGVAPLELTADGQRGKIFFASEGGTTRKLAENLLQQLRDHNVPFDLVDPATYEPEDLVKERAIVIIASTWQDGKAPANASFLAQWLQESSADFRVGSGILQNCRFLMCNPLRILFITDRDFRMKFTFWNTRCIMLSLGTGDVP